MFPGFPDLLARWRASPSPADAIALCHGLADVFGVRAPGPEPAQPRPPAPNGFHEVVVEVGRGASDRWTEDAEVLLAVGRMYLSAGGLLRDAASIIVRGARLVPTDPRAFRLLGETLLRRGDARRAVHAFERAILGGLKDPDTRAWHRRSRAYEWLQNRFGEAAVIDALARDLGEPPPGGGQMQLSQLSAPDEEDEKTRAMAPKTGVPAHLAATRVGPPPEDDDEYDATLARLPGHYRDLRAGGPDADDDLAPTGMRSPSNWPTALEGSGAAPSLPPPADDDDMATKVTSMHSIIASLEALRPPSSRSPRPAAGQTLSVIPPPPPHRPDRDAGPHLDEAHRRAPTARPPPPVTSAPPLSARAPALPPSTPPPSPRAPSSRPMAETTPDGPQAPRSPRAFSAAGNTAPLPALRPPSEAPRTRTEQMPAVPSGPRGAPAVLSRTIPLGNAPYAAGGAPSGAPPSSRRPPPPPLSGRGAPPSPRAGGPLGSQPPSSGARSPSGSPMAPQELREEFTKSEYRLPIELPPLPSMPLPRIESAGTSEEDKTIIALAPSEAPSSLSEADGRPLLVVPLLDEELPAGRRPPSLAPMRSEGPFAGTLLPVFVPRGRRESRTWMVLLAAALLVGGGVAAWLTLGPPTPPPPSNAAALADAAVRSGSPAALASAQRALGTARGAGPDEAALALAGARTGALRVIEDGPVGIEALRSALADTRRLRLEDQVPAGTVALELAGGSDARGTVQSLDAAASRSSDALYQLVSGAALEQQGADAALARYQAAVTAQPGWLPAELRLARAHLLAGDVEAGRARLRGLSASARETQVLEALAAVIDGSATSALTLAPADIADLPRPLRTIAWSLSVMGRPEARGASSGLTAAIEDADTPAVAAFAGLVAIGAADAEAAALAAQRAGDAVGEARELAAQKELLAGAFEAAKGSPLARGLALYELGEPAKPLEVSPGRRSAAARFSALLGGAVPGPLGEEARKRFEAAHGKPSLEAAWIELFLADAALDAGDLPRAHDLLDRWTDAAKQAVFAPRRARLLRLEKKLPEARVALGQAQGPRAWLERVLLDGDDAAARKRSLSQPVGADARARWERAWLEAKDGDATEARRMINRSRLPPDGTALATLAALTLAELKDQNGKVFVERQLALRPGDPDLRRAATALGLKTK